MIMIMTTNSSFTSKFDTLTVANNKLPRFEMKLDNVSVLPTQLAFNRTFNDKMCSSRILSYHNNKFRIYIEYDRNYSTKFTLKTELLTPNGWSIIFTRVDIPLPDEVMNNNIFHLTGDELDFLNDVTNHIEEEFIKLIILMY